MPMCLFTKCRFIILNTEQSPESKTKLNKKHVAFGSIDYFMHPNQK